jgi:putative tryptophan/tyrosine transport system substrate-binding protein
VIVSAGDAATALAAKGATQEPIVFGTGTDPVQIGLVASLRRPAANLTGVTTVSRELAAKRLELIHELVPAATLIAYLINPANSVFAATESGVVETAARTMGVRLLTLNASTRGEIDVAFERAAFSTATNRPGAAVHPYRACHQPEDRQGRLA